MWAGVGADGGPGLVAAPRPPTIKSIQIPVKIDAIPGLPEASASQNPTTTQRSHTQHTTKMFRFLEKKSSFCLSRWLDIIRMRMWVFQGAVQDL